MGTSLGAGTGPGSFAEDGAHSLYRVNFWVAGADEAARVLEGIDLRAADLSGAWPEVDRVFALIVRQTFSSEGESAGQRWRDLAPSTQAERRRLGYGPQHPILRRTGALLGSLTELTTDAISVHAPGFYARGSGVPYFGFHQSRAPRTRLPRRAPFEPTPDDVTALMRPVRLWLTGRAPGGTAQSDAALLGTFAPTTGGLA